VDGVTVPTARAALNRGRRLDPKTMLDSVAHLRERHGGPGAYLYASGLTREDVVTLTDRLCH
jgi:hypothetical protein